MVIFNSYVKLPEGKSPGLVMKNPQTFDAAPGATGARTSCRTSICAEVNSMFSMKPCLGQPKTPPSQKWPGKKKRENGDGNTILLSYRWVYIYII